MEDPVYNEEDEPLEEPDLFTSDVVSDPDEDPLLHDHEKTQEEGEYDDEEDEEVNMINKSAVEFFCKPSMCRNNCCTIHDKCAIKKSECYYFDYCQEYLCKTECCKTS